jgi:hypothetical protein
MSPEDLDEIDYILVDLVFDECVDFDSPRTLARFDYMPAFALGLAERYVDVVERRKPHP